MRLQTIDEVTTKKYTVEDTELIFDEIGFGNYQLQLLFIVGGGRACDAIEIAFLSIIQSCVVSEWGISSGFESLVTSTVFIGQLFGMFFIGPLADKHGRRPIVLFGWLLSIVFGILSCFSPNIWFFIVTRLLVGVGIGASLAISFGLFLESLPKRYRTHLMLLSGFAVLGELYLTSFAWASLTTLGWRYLAFFASLPTIVITVCGYFMLKESPRWLISKGQVRKAEKIILSIARKNGLKDFKRKLAFHGPQDLHQALYGSSESSYRDASRDDYFNKHRRDRLADSSYLGHQISRSVSTGGQSDAFNSYDSYAQRELFANYTPAVTPDDTTSDDGSEFSGDDRDAMCALMCCGASNKGQEFRELFSESMAPTTVMIWLQWFMFSFSFYSANLLMVFTFREGAGSPDATENTVTADSNNNHGCSFQFGPLFVAQFLGLVGIYGGYALNQHTTVGRAGSQAQMYMLTMVFLALFIALKQTTGTESAVYQGMIMLAKVAVCGAVPITWVHTAELYPTKIRGTGQSMASALGKIGAVAAVVWIDYFAADSLGASVALAIVASVATAICSLLLPETSTSALNDAEGSSDSEELMPRARYSDILSQNLTTLTGCMCCAPSLRDGGQVTSSERGYSDADQEETATLLNR